MVKKISSTLKVMYYAAAVFYVALFGAVLVGGIGHNLNVPEDQAGGGQIYGAFAFLVMLPCFFIILYTGAVTLYRGIKTRSSNALVAAVLLVSIIFCAVYYQ